MKFNAFGELNNLLRRFPQSLLKKWGAPAMLSVLLLSSHHITCCTLLSTVVCKVPAFVFYAVIKKKKESNKPHYVLAICDKGHFAVLKIYGIMTSHDI